MPPTVVQAHALPRADLNSHLISNASLPSELGVLIASVKEDHCGAIKDEFKME